MSIWFFSQVLIDRCLNAYLFDLVLCYALKSLYVVKNHTRWTFHFMSFVLHLRSQHVVPTLFCYLVLGIQTALRFVSRALMSSRSCSQKIGQLLCQFEVVYHNVYGLILKIYNIHGNVLRQLTSIYLLYYLQIVFVVLCWPHLLESNSRTHVRIMTWFTD